jgi:hypothetical protein
MLLGTTNHMENMMKGIDAALTKLIKGFEGFTNELRNMANGHDVAADNYDGDEDHDAGFGEEPDNYPEDLEPVAREDIDDDTMVTLRSGDLRKVLDAYRKLTRFAREGRIPTQDERLKLHQYIKKVKHLVRKPV